VLIRPRSSPAGDEVFDSRKRIALSLLTEAESFGIGSLRTRSFDPKDVVCLTLSPGGHALGEGLSAAKERLAGNGAEASRASASQAAASQAASTSRRGTEGLFPVRNSSGSGGDHSLAAYALDAFRGLGRHLIVIRGWKRRSGKAFSSPSASRHRR